MTCDYCGSTDFHVAELHVFEMEFEDEKLGYACDVMMRCAQCGARDVFGVAISKDEYLAFPAKWQTSKEDKILRFTEDFKTYYYKITKLGMIEIIPRYEQDVIKEYSFVTQGRVRTT